MSCGESVAETGKEGDRRATVTENLDLLHTAVLYITNESNRDSGGQQHRELFRGILANLAGGGGVSLACVFARHFRKRIAAHTIGFGGTMSLPLIRCVMLGDSAFSRRGRGLQ